MIGLISSVGRADQYNIDYPHYQQETIGCDSCHYMVYDTPPAWATHVPLDIDDTPITSCAGVAENAQKYTVRVECLQ